MKRFIYIAILQTLGWLAVYGQPPLNQRYIINENLSSVFASVSSNDSCYYISGINTDVGSYYELKSHLVKYNFDGTIENFAQFSNDTLGIGFFGFSPIVKTLDGNFAQLATADAISFEPTFLFVKMTPNGDTIFTKYYPEFYEEDYNNGKNAATIIQNKDSTYFGLIHIQNDTNFLGGVTFFRLDKDGALLYKKSFYGISLESYNTLRSASMVRYSDTTLVIGAAYLKVYGDNDEKRHHTKLLIVDTLGNLIDEHTYWEDTLALDCYGLTKTADGGLIYCGRIGRYSAEYNVIGYKAQIVKLNADFTKAWQIKIGSGYTGSPYIGLRNILTLNDSEFVAVGFMKTFEPNDRNQYGWLIKFNIHGEKIWERKYLKITHVHLAPNYPTHELYDVDITPDGGFVMVGQAINYYDDNGFLPGQKAWLLKVDKFGCLVPNCQYISANGNPLEIEPPKDTVIVNPPKEEPITWLYPNPASTNLFYYHHQENFQFGTAYIYNAAGEVVQK